MASEAAVVAQGLECCLCFEYFQEPKLLSCTHTFCKNCLHRLCECHPHQYQIVCPICRQITNIEDGDVSKLQTNIPINSMVDDLKSAKNNCTICDPEAKSHAVQYCAQCDEYMCDLCIVTHGKFKKNAKHDVVSVEDVKRGKIKVKRFCLKHPEEEKLYVCTSCNLSICFRCRMIDHGDPDHEIKEVSDYKKTIQKQIESLQKKATSTIVTIEAHSQLVKEQKEVVEVELDQKVDEINKSYEEAVKHLTSQRNDLIARCEKRKVSCIAQLAEIKKSDDQKISCIRSASELVGNGIKALLEGQTLAVHSTICSNLEKMLSESNLDATQPRSIADSAKLVNFTKSSTPNSLGDLHIPDWHLESVSIFPLSHKDPRDALPLPDGRVAVGYGVYGKGKAIEMFTVDGPQETVLRSNYVTCVSALSDSRYVVLHSGYDITLYTQAWEKINVRFNKPFHNKSDKQFWGDGGICVDRDDNIYYAHPSSEKIFVFPSEGGDPLREIPCRRYKPVKICHMNHSKSLVMLDNAGLVLVMDEEGTILHQIQGHWQTTVTILKDDSILIGCMMGNLLSMELYTKDLKRIRTVLGDVQFANGLEFFRKLVELPTGQIVAVSNKQFIVFHMI